MTKNENLQISDQRLKEMRQEVLKWIAKNEKKMKQNQKKKKKKKKPHCDWSNISLSFPRITLHFSVIQAFVGGMLAVLLCLFIITASGIYLFQSSGATIKILSKLFPLPALKVGGEYMSYSRALSDMEKLKIIQSRFPSFHMGYMQETSLDHMYITYLKILYEKKKRSMTFSPEDMKNIYFAWNGFNLSHKDFIQYVLIPSLTVQKLIPIYTQHSENWKIARETAKKIMQQLTTEPIDEKDLWKIKDEFQSEHITITINRTGFIKKTMNLNEISITQEGNGIHIRKISDELPELHLARLVDIHIIPHEPFGSIFQKRMSEIPVRIYALPKIGGE